jgi:hypothetical protein
MPQSAQSLPSAHSAKLAPDPPSSHTPSRANEQLFSQSSGAELGMQAVACAAGRPLRPMNRDTSDGEVPGTAAHDMFWDADFATQLPLAPPSSEAQNVTANPLRSGQVPSQLAVQKP